MLRAIGLRLLILGVWATLLAGCSQPPVLNEESSAGANFVVARADSSYALTGSDFYAALRKSMVHPSGGYVDPALVTAFRDSMIVDSLLGFEADQYDLRQSYVDNWTYRLRYEDFLMQTFFEQTVYNRVIVDSLEVLEYHKNHPELFSIPEQLDLWHILIVPAGLTGGKDSLYYRSLGPDEFEAAMKEYALNVYRALAMGENFQAMAMTYSHDLGTKSKGGYQGWVSRNTYLPPFDSVAFSMKPGEISQPYRDKDGWHILHVDDYLPAGPTPIDREMFYLNALQTLQTVKSNEIGLRLVDSLRKDLTIVMNEAILDTNIYKVEDSVWCGIVNGTDTFDVKYLKNIEEAYRNRFRVPNTTPELKRAMIRQMAERFMVVYAARQAGLDTLLTVREQRHALRHETARSVLERTRYDVNWFPTDSAVRRYYQDHIKEFTVEKPLTVQQIIAKDSVLAEFLRDQADAGADFLELARQYYPGDPSVREELANLGAIGPRDVDSAFYREALGTPIGQISRPVKTKYGWQIIKVLKFEDSKGLDQARGEIQAILTRQYKQAQLDQLRNRLFRKYHVSFPSKLGRVHLRPYAERAY